MEGHGHTVDEETPLLAVQPGKPKPTPLPKKQLACLLMLQLAEPISSQVIYPFIAQVCIGVAYDAHSVLTTKFLQSLSPRYL
jgi:hypothetical protein